MGEEDYSEYLRKMIKELTGEGPIAIRYPTDKAFLRYLISKKDFFGLFGISCVCSDHTSDATKNIWPAVILRKDLPNGGDRRLSFFRSKTGWESNISNH
jgi:hypothetical protein